MERYSSRTLDEQGQVVLHDTLRKKLRLDKGVKLAINHVDTLLILQRVADSQAIENAVCEVDDLGRIILPEEIRRQLNWSAKDELALYHTDKLIILKSA